MKAKQYTYKYPRPSVTADCVVFAYEEGTLRLLLVQRAGDPYRGMWALPGGFVEMEEDLEAAALRELREETGFDPSHLEQLRAYGRPDRDPRGRVITVAFLALVRRPETPVCGGTDAADAQWFALSELPPLAFDHAEIFRDAQARLRETIRHAPVGIDLLPEAFTLTQLQAVYEAVLGQPLDKRNFRKKILGFGVLAPLPGQLSTGRQRPAQLYAFDPLRYHQLRQDGILFQI